jgi:putative transposase
MGIICSVTIGTRARRSVFAEPGIAQAANDVLHGHACRTGVQVFAYCLMPNHVHLVLGPSSSCDIVTFVGQFKNLAQRQVWKLGVTGRIWQESFWDRFLREEESLDEIVRYVLHNPVRKGLVERWQDYHFSGSLVYDLDGEF